MRSLMILLLLAGVLASCSSGTRSDARGRYNHGIELMAEGDLDRAENAFVDARSEAGPDQSLRYSAAFNLGMLYLRKADELELSEPDKALQELQKARTWFQDAARIKSDDEDARVNLEITIRRMQVLADQMNQGKNGLEARLDRVIEEERALRDQVRQLMEAVRAAKVESDPIAFRTEFGMLATAERTLMAEAGTVLDLASDELGLLDGQDPKEMSPEDQMRQIQLQGLEHYLQAARVSIDDARRALRGLDAGKSHDASTRALAQLKRAREQLWDPVTALKALAQDHEGIVQHTSAHVSLSAKTLSIDGKTPDKPAEQIPAWLNGEHLAAREGDVIERCSELLMRFQAASQAPEEHAGQGQDPKTARMIEMAGKAAPHLTDAVAAMEQARDALLAEKIEQALPREVEARGHLLAAMEYFLELKNLIELTYAEHSGVTALIDPSKLVEETGQGQELLEMPADKRAGEALEDTARNMERLARMQALIEEQKQETLAQLQAQAQQTGQEPPADATALYERAEGLRVSAAGKLELLRAQLDRLAGAQALASGDVPPLQLAEEARTDIEELRRLFFSIVEHLKELHREQSESYDETGSVAMLDDDAERAQRLAPLAERQGTHASMAEALAQALEQQAEAAGQSQDQQAAAQAQTFTDAAAEVRAALSAMQNASSVLVEARDNAEAMSVDLTPALDEQPVAIEHIQKAIEILEPPQDQQQDQQDQNQDQQDQDQQDQDQDQDQQKQQKQQEDISKQQAERRLQEIRDREAQRRREQEEAQAVPGGGVEMDW